MGVCGKNNLVRNSGPARTDPDKQNFGPVPTSMGDTVSLILLLRGYRELLKIFKVEGQGDIINQMIYRHPFPSHVLLCSS